MLFDFLFAEGHRDRCHHIDAHMESFIIVEVHCTGNVCDDFIEITKEHTLEEFVLHRVIDSFGLCIVPRVSGFCHTDKYMIVVQ